MFPSLWRIEEILFKEIKSVSLRFNECEYRKDKISLTHLMYNQFGNYFTFLNVYLKPQFLLCDHVIMELFSSWVLLIFSLNNI